MAYYFGSLPDAEFYTAADAATRLGVSRARISHMVRDGQLDAYYYLRHLYLSRAQVDALDARRRARRQTPDAERIA